tara:strand:- start:967 stop:1092 length:126 start_codon:yes stop_codon:yes gene_type:complete
MGVAVTVAKLVSVVAPVVATVVVMIRIIVAKSCVFFNIIKC